MVWAGTSCNYRTQLVVVDGNITARRYIDQILQPNMIPFMQQHQDVAMFQHDNARPHSARVTQAYLLAQGIDVLPWPAICGTISVA
ncbi:Transposable element Tcb1 transposase, partial [Clarias magur]